ncbi:MAG TPA: ATP-binding protein, partial [Pirellulales bacterium]|nr:ATP-binding protein [Pirellulales bacterium]
MLTDEELGALMSDLESDRTERKASIADRDRIRQAICAFANDLPDHRLPGVLLIGANDDGTCAHLPITDQLLQTLADMRSDGIILPFPAMTVQKRTIRGCDLAVIEVQPAYTPPVRFNGRVWIRV